MKKIILLWAVVSMLAGLFAFPVAFSESMAYGDLIGRLVESWDPSASRDDLTKLHGEPLYDAEAYMSFWDKEKGIQLTYNYKDGRLTFIEVSYVLSSKESWNAAYQIFHETDTMLIDTLGEKQSYICHYNGDERNAIDVDCYVSTWNANGVNVLMVYNQTEAKVYVNTKISAIR